MSSSEVGDCCRLTPFWELNSAKDFIDGNFNWFRVCLLMEWLHKRLQANKAQVEWTSKIPLNTVMVQNTELPRQDAWSGSARSTAAVLRRFLPCDVYPSTVNYQVGGAWRVTRRPLTHTHRKWHDGVPLIGRSAGMWRRGCQINEFIKSDSSPVVYWVTFGTRVWNWPQLKQVSRAPRQHGGRATRFVCHVPKRHQPPPP